ncbi:MAG TPA: response regulator [Gemmatimonadales bacterium]|nr:response regulator [Gemmatimonadales bacterium]
MNTILVVDDEASIRRALRNCLERAGFGVEEAASGREALAHVASGRPADAVVSDVLMPEINGLAFYDELVEISPELASRVVFLTGASADPRVHGPIEQRGVPLLSKTDDLRLVVDAVRVALLHRAATPHP